MLMLMIWLLAFIFIFGICFGSFLNVLIYRLPHSLPLTGRSFCPKCKKKIIWYDNIPLISYVLLKGQCRQCHSPISWRYPVVELMTGILFLGVWVKFGDLGILGILGSWVIVSALVVVFFIDLDHQIIPDQVLFPALATAFLISLSLNILVSSLLTAIVAGLFFLALHLLTKGRGMGMGDVNLSFLIGLVLGFPKAVFAFYLAFLTGAFVGVILIVARRKKFGQPMAFGPFLVAAGLIFLFWGDRISQWLTAHFF